jgi:hypothetical protein
MAELLYDGNDNLIRLTGAYTIDQDTDQPAYLTDSATVGVTLIDLLTDDDVVGETWPVSLTYVAGSQGDFVGVLRDGITVSPGQALIARVTIDNGTDQYGQIDVDVQVVNRRL